MLRFVKNRFSRTIIIIAACISIIWASLAISSALTEPEAHIAPDYPKINLVPLLSKTQLSDSDYETLFYQTGLGKPAIDEMKKGSPDFIPSILRFQENFFKDIKYVCEKNSSISKEESIVDENGRCINGTELAPLHNGYILITKSSHTYGWRHGHAALIVDAAQGKALESVVIGTDSCVQYIDKWTNYPNFMLLRLKDASMESLNEIAQSALINLNNVPYSFMVGIFSPKFKKTGEIKGTQCSHLVWEAFRFSGHDLDSDGGKIVTPKDIANSPYLEVVQVFGVNPKKIWP